MCLERLVYIRCSEDQDMYFLGYWFSESCSNAKIPPPPPLLPNVFFSALKSWFSLTNLITISCYIHLFCLCQVLNACLSGAGIFNIKFLAYQCILHHGLILLRYIRILWHSQVRIGYRTLVRLYRIPAGT